MRWPIAAMAVAGVAIAAFAVWLLVVARHHDAPPAAHPEPPASPAPAPAPAIAQPPQFPSPALVAPAPDAREPSERERWVKTVIESGSGHEQWTDRGTELLQLIAREAAHTEQLGCYVAGCTATYTFASHDAYERAFDAAQKAPEYTAWTGGKRWSTPEQAANGEVTTALLLYRPD